MPLLEIKPPWRKLVSNPIVLFTFLAFLLAIPRFYWLLNDKYNYIILLFVLMWSFPFLFLSQEGRRSIGLIKPSRYIWLLNGFLIGLMLAVLIYLVGVLLFKHTEENWYVTIMGSFNKGDIIKSIKPNISLFLLVTFPTMIFSPIGEELFFRGMIHEAYASKYGNQKGMLIDASFFGITHMAHHGLLKDENGFRLLPSSLIWVLLMMIVAVLFYFIKRKSGSIWGAVFCHAGFNFGMMGSIIYLLHE